MIVSSVVSPNPTKGLASPVQLLSVTPQGAATAVPDVLVAAHRGFHSGNAPYENTIAAYRAAIKLGADLLETDIRRTADGVLVLHHDAHIGAALIAKTKFADLPLLPSGERVSLFSDLIELEATSGGHSRLLLETKETGYEQTIVQMLRAKLRPGQYELMSFRRDSVAALHRYAPDSHVGLLVSIAPDWETGNWPVRGADIVKYARQAGADFVALSQFIATSDRLQTVHDAGLALGVYTVEDPGRLQRFLTDRRIGLVISDRPDVALRLRDTPNPVPAPLRGLDRTTLGCSESAVVRC